MKGAKDPDLLENHHILNDMVHEMDKTRLTTMAVISMCNISESQYIEIPDLVSYNQYLGWYGGKIEENGPFMDSFHEMYPNIPIGMSTVQKPTSGILLTRSRAIIQKNIRHIIMKNSSSSSIPETLYGLHMFGICLTLQQMPEMRADARV